MEGETSVKFSRSLIFRLRGGYENSTHAAFGDACVYYLKTYLNLIARTSHAWREFHSALHNNRWWKNPEFRLKRKLAKLLPFSLTTPEEHTLCLTEFFTEHCASQFLDLFATICCILPQFSLP